MTNISSREISFSINIGAGNARVRTIRTFIQQFSEHEKPGVLIKSAHDSHAHNGGTTSPPGVNCRGTLNVKIGRRYGSTQPSSGERGKKNEGEERVPKITHSLSNQIA